MNATTRNAVGDYVFWIIGGTAIIGAIYVIYRMAGVAVYLAGGGGW